MTRFFKLLIATALISLLFCTASAAPSLISESAVLMDAETGQVLYDKNMHVQKHPASITKIATVICGLENGNLSDKITMSENAVFSVSRNSSHIALDVGEELTLEEASYAALLVSANEACNGIAEHCGGTIENFVSMMNNTAKEAGAKTRPLLTQTVFATNTTSQQLTIWRASRAMHCVMTTSAKSSALINTRWLRPTNSPRNAFS